MIMKNAIRLKRISLIVWRTRASYCSLKPKEAPRTMGLFLPRQRITIGYAA